MSLNDFNFLVAAVMNDDASKIDELSHKGADIKARGSYGETLLHYAAFYGKLNIAGLLISKGLNIAVRDNGGQSPFDLAKTNNHKEIQGLLTRTQYGYDGLLLGAMERGQVTEVENLLSKGADVNVVGEYFNSPLHLAVNRNNLSLVDLLVQNGANIRAKNSNGNTPLDVAREHGRSKIVDTLTLHQGIYDNDLLATLEKGNITKIRSLISRGADVNLRGYLGRTPLHLAAYTGKEVAFLLSRGAKTEIGDDNGWKPLHWAVWQNQKGAVQDLLRWFPNIRAKTNDGQTPLDVAKDYKRSEIIGILNRYQESYDESLFDAVLSKDINKVVGLVRAGANVNAVNNLLYTPLHVAAEADSLDVIVYLADHGADINARSEDGSTPLDLLERNSRAEDKDVGTPSHLSKRRSEVIDLLRVRSHHIVHKDHEKHHNTSHLEDESTLENVHIVGIKRRPRSIENANFLVEDNQATSGASKPSSWINDLCGWVKEKSEVVVSNVVNGLYGGTAKELEGYKSGNIQTGSKKSEKTSSATLLNVSHSGKSPVQGISKENVSNKGWSSSRRKVEGSTNFGAALPKGASSTASSISQVYAQPDITGLMLLVPIFMNTMGRKFVLPLLSADQPISPEKAQVHALNIIEGFKEVLKQQAALKDGIKVHRLDIDFVKVEEEITGKIMVGKFNEISGILKSYAEKACPSREAGCSGRLSQKKFDKFMTEFNSIIDPVINQSMQQMLSRLEVSDVKEQQISLKPKSYLNDTSVQGHLTQGRDLKNQDKVLIP